MYDALDLKTTLDVGNRHRQAGSPSQLGRPRRRRSPRRSPSTSAPPPLRKPTCKHSSCPRNPLAVKFKTNVNDNCEIMTIIENLTIKVEVNFNITSSVKQSIKIHIFDLNVKFVKWEQVKLHENLCSSCLVQIMQQSSKIHVWNAFFYSLYASIIDAWLLQKLKQ